MNLRSIFVKAGGTAWLLLVGLSAIVFGLQQLGLVDGSRFPWTVTIAVLGIGGLGCFLIAAAMAMWQRG